MKNIRAAFGYPKSTIDDTSSCVLKSKRNIFPNWIYEVPTGGLSRSNVHLNLYYILRHPADFNSIQNLNPERALEYNPIHPKPPVIPFFAFDYFQIEFENFPLVIIFRVLFVGFVGVVTIRRRSVGWCRLVCIDDDILISGIAWSLCCCVTKLILHVFQYRNAGDKSIFSIQNRIDDLFYATGHELDLHDAGEHFQFQNIINNNNGSGWCGLWMAPYARRHPSMTVAN